MEKPKVLIEITGDSAESLYELQTITNTAEPLDVVMNALKVYAWVLAKQANGGVIVAEYPTGEKTRFPGREEELNDYVKNKEKALAFFEGRDLF